jgi:hypothetical protein
LAGFRILNIPLVAPNSHRTSSSYMFQLDVTRSAAPLEVFYLAQLSIWSAEPLLPTSIGPICRHCTEALPRRLNVLHALTATAR